MCTIGDSDSDCVLKANPRLADRRDDDDRLPLHWAVSYNHLGVVELLVQTKNFDPDVQVRLLSGWMGEKHGFSDDNEKLGWVGLDSIDDRGQSQRSG